VTKRKNSLHGRRQVGVTRPIIETADYRGRLLQRTMPELPGLPSQSNLERWQKTCRRREQEGIALLLKHHGISLLQPEREQLRDLVLALARCHVPFFKTKRSKSPGWNGFALARLLQAYQDRIRAGSRPEHARAAAKRQLPGKLAGRGDKAIRNQLSAAREAFRSIVTAAPDGLLEPIDERGAHWWRFMLRGLTREAGDENITFEPDRANPRNVLVSGLPRVPEQPPPLHSGTAVREHPSSASIDRDTKHDDVSPTDPPPRG
jgi:hypothetical protein